MKNEDLIIEMLKEMGESISTLNERITTMDERITAVQTNLSDQIKEIAKRMDRLEHRVERVEDGQRDDRKLLMDIWQHRDKVTAKVRWDFLWKATAFNGFLLVFMFFVLQV